MSEEQKRGRGRPRKVAPETGPTRSVTFHAIDREREGWVRIKLVMTEEEALTLGEVQGSPDVRERLIAAIGSDLRRQ